MYRVVYRTTQCAWLIGLVLVPGCLLVLWVPTTTSDVDKYGWETTRYGLLNYHTEQRCVILRGSFNMSPGAPPIQWPVPKITESPEARTDTIIATTILVAIELLATVLLLVLPHPCYLPIAEESRTSQPDSQDSTANV